MSVEAAAKDAQLERQRELERAELVNEVTVAKRDLDKQLTDMRCEMRSEMGAFMQSVLSRCSPDILYHKAHTVLKWLWLE